MATTEIVQSSKRLCQSSESDFGHKIVRQLLEKPKNIRYVHSKDINRVEVEAEWLVQLFAKLKHSICQLFGWKDLEHRDFHQLVVEDQYYLRDRYHEKRYDQQHLQIVDHSPQN